MISSPYSMLQNAVKGNQNMIRIWGGGLYQRDYLYDVADRMGLLVCSFQQFLFYSILFLFLVLSSLIGLAGIHVRLFSLPS